MSAEFEDVLTNQPVVIDNVSSPVAVCPQPVRVSVLTCAIVNRARAR